LRGGGARKDEAVDDVASSKTSDAAYACNPLASDATAPVTW
jgi:hypothetical protein